MARLAMRSPSLRTPSSTSLHGDPPRTYSDQHDSEGQSKPPADPGTSNGSATPKSLALLRVPTPAAKFSRWAAKKRESREIGVSGGLRATRLQEQLVDPERSRPASRSDAQRDTAPNRRAWPPA